MFGFKFIKPMFLGEMCFETKPDSSL